MYNTIKRQIPEVELNKAKGALARKTSLIKAQSVQGYKGPL